LVTLNGDDFILVWLHSKKVIYTIIPKVWQ